MVGMKGERGEGRKKRSFILDDIGDNGFGIGGRASGGMKRPDYDTEITPSYSLEWRLTFQSGLHKKGIRTLER